MNILFSLIGTATVGAPGLRCNNPIRRAPSLIYAVALGFSCFAGHANAQTGLQVSYGASGVQQITYNSVLLEDVAANPSDAFHIWHMKATDLQGHLLTGGQYGWGEDNSGKSWNAVTNTWTYNFVWGTITVQFTQSANALNVTVVTTNISSSGIIFDGASIYPFVLHFPALPKGFVDASYAQLAFNTTGPSVTLADYGQGEVAAVYPNAIMPLYSGFQPAGSANSYTAIMSGTALDGMASFDPQNDRPIYPGQTDSYTVSLRFAPSGTPTSGLASDAYSAWAAGWPPALHWTDRRIIGTVYLASSPSGNPTLPDGYPNNPRRYFNDSNSADFDVRTAAGLVSFQNRILQQAAANVQNLTQLNAQGAITWDIEGEQYPQTTSYVCEPDLISTIAPEMESVIQNPSSPYNGMRLDDAYFKIIRSAGFRVGVCIRPQHFTMNPDGSAASQMWLADSQVVAELIRKIGFAHSRWGATIFYIDSTVDSKGETLDAYLFQDVAAAFPDSLLIPEESTPKDYAYASAFQSFLFHTDLGTSLDVYNYYPKAFSANLVNDVDPATLALYRPQLTASVKRGDVLMVHADYWQANNPTVVEIYQDAAGTALPPPIPAPPNASPAASAAITSPSAESNTTTPPASTHPIMLTYPMSGLSVSATIAVVATIGQTLDAAGSYLMLDGQEVGAARITNPPYAYQFSTAGLASGKHTLQIWAHDTNNDTLLSNAVVINVP